MTTWPRRAVMLLLVMASAAFAEDTAKARDAFVKGQALYAAGKYKDALAKFEESLAAKPHPATVFNIARCQDQLSELVPAMTSYKEYLRLSPKATDADEVVKAIASLEGRLQARGVQHVLVYVDPPTATVRLDGKALTGTPPATSTTPGTHTLTITADGYEKYERTFAMSATRSHEVTVSLAAAAPKVASGDPLPFPTPATPSLTPSTTPASTDGGATSQPSLASSVQDTATPAPKKRVFTWVAAGTAGVATGLGVVFSVLMKSNETALMTLTPNRTRAEANALYEGAFAMGTAATASFITAGVAAIAAVVLFFLEGS